MRRWQPKVLGEKRRTVRPAHAYVTSVLVYAYAATVLCVVAASAQVLIRMRTPVRSKPVPVEISEPKPALVEVKPSCRAQCLANGFMPSTHPDKEIDGKAYCECDRTKVVFPSGGKPK